MDATLALSCTIGATKQVGRSVLLHVCLLLRTKKKINHICFEDSGKTIFVLRTAQYPPSLGRGRQLQRRVEKQQQRGKQ